ncbi:hypothetical protein [Sphaerisporangium aureirubrum]|uniref:Uncharacterized protein n=1 Tax=Sphaerisporangium aureirubrum TaxID=1544736 RepID=A0ABW1NB66_9ACTN
MIEIRAGANIAVVRIAPQDSYQAAYDKSLAACQQGLDLISMTRGLAFAIKDTDSHLVWWNRSHETIARLTLFVVATFDAPPAPLRVLDSNGMDVTPTPVPPAWDQSYRYYRLSQITPDMADAYRNMFLMLESLLSDIRPQRYGERENDWLKAALGEAHRLYNLSGFSNLAKPGREAEGLRSDFATEARHPLNHAKRQRNNALPLERALRKTLLDKLERLSALCLYVAEKRFGVRRIQGGIFPSWVRSSLDQRTTAAFLILNNEQRELDLQAQSIPIASEATSLWITARRDTSYEDAYRYAMFGQASKVELAKIDTIRRVISTLDGINPFGEGQLDNALNPAGISCLQMVFGLHVLNRRSNRRDYNL